jgi:hypothetical protein
VLGSAIFAHGPASGAPQEKATIAECAENLQLPRYGVGGGPGAIDGPIVVSLVPNSSGRPESVVIEGGSRGARIIAEAWLLDSTFASSCVGKRVSFTLSFVIEGPPIEYPFSWVTFHGPDHFTVHSRARIASVLRMPDKNAPVPPQAKKRFHGRSQGSVPATRHEAGVDRVRPR